jgi:hypothetical protein
MSLTLGNPLGGVAAGAVSFNQFAIKNAGRSLSTGRTADNDVVSDFLGKGLSDKYFILSKININMGYSKNALKVASAGLESIAKTLADMLAVVAQSTSGTNIDTLNDILQQKLNQVELQTKAATFDNRQLLTGALGQDSTVRTNFTNKAVSVKSMPAAGNFLGTGTPPATTTGKFTVTAAAPAVGATVTVNGVVFTAAAGPRVAGTLNWDQTSNATSADSLAAACIDIQANGTLAQRLALANYNFTSDGVSLFTVTQKTPRNEVLATAVTSSSAITLLTAQTTAGVSSAGVQGVFAATANGVAVNDTISIAGITFTAQTGARAAGSLTFDRTSNATSAASLTAALLDIQANGTVDQRLALSNYTFSTDTNGISVVARQITAQDNAQAFTQSGATFNLLAAPAGVEATGANVQSQLTIGNVVAGDSVVIEGVTFKAVAGEPVNDGEFKVGISANDSAGNLARAIQGSKSETMQAFTTSIANNVITLTRVSQGTAGITIVNKSLSIIGIETTKGNGSGIDLSGIRTLDGFIGVSSKPIFAYEYQESGLGAKAKAISAGNVLAAGAAAAAAGDSVAIYSTVIGGRKFTGAFYEANAAQNLNNAELKMIEEDTGEYFTIKAAAGYAGRINTPTVAGQAGTGVVADLNTLFATTNFNETKTLEINTNKGDILVDNVPIASTTGTVVKLTATDFTKLQFKDFLIEPGSAVGNVKFTAVITDKDGIDQSYTNDVPAASIPLMIEGYKLDLTDSTGGTGNVLSINIGERGITSLNLAANYAAVAQAYKDMLLSTGDGLEVRVGLNFDDILKATIKDISASKLYLDENGLYQSNLDLSTDSGRKVAQTVITNALATVRGEQSRVTSQMESIQEASDALAITIQVTKEASDGYLNTDLIEAAQAFSEAVKRTIAAISTLEAGNKVSDAAQRVIQSIA